MKILKIIVKIVGILWMVIFSLTTIFIFSTQPFDFSTTYGIGYFSGMLIFFILLIGVGYLLFRWGGKKSVA
ncbi:cbb3-type cytochrome oxidase subunit 3 [Algoriphagus iocasae]|uniref:Cbb3-type cytochrome oxidase subunit 3 n=1 Tax=Algoriphagus iocasae TaxID=1836499 RepID=A0A841MT64_9BACT|nr:hypothetical protein [Algoriphagus iocasae]MBB6327834.1 cbb3-type cytochrome oxidase subunit 3 [Algoriphagus iocasae]